MDDITNAASKGGEEIIRVRIRRALKSGTQLTVWAHPLIEDFFKSHSDGLEPQNVSQFGNQWRRAKESAPLTFYPAAALNMGSTDNDYTLTPIGDELIIDERHSGIRGGVVNMSILRLVGISEGVGISFYINHVGSAESLSKLANRLTDGAKAFYIEHLKPFDMNVSIVAQRL